MKSPIVKRSIVIGGHKTSVSLEDAFWRGLKDVARTQRTTLVDHGGRDRQVPPSKPTFPRPSACSCSIGCARRHRILRPMGTTGSRPSIATAPRPSIWCGKVSTRTSEPLQAMNASGCASARPETFRRIGAGVLPSRGRGMPQRHDHGRRRRHYPAGQRRSRAPVRLPVAANCSANRSKFCCLRDLRSTHAGPRHAFSQASADPPLRHRARVQRPAQGWRRISHRSRAPSDQSRRRAHGGQRYPRHQRTQASGADAE